MLRPHAILASRHSGNQKAATRLALVRPVASRDGRRSSLRRARWLGTLARPLCRRAVLEKAGVEFIAENGGGPGVRLAKRKTKR